MTWSGLKDIYDFIISEIHHHVRSHPKQRTPPLGQFDSIERVARYVSSTIYYL